MNKYNKFQILTYMYMNIILFLSKAQRSFDVLHTEFAQNLKREYDYAYLMACDRQYASCIYKKLVIIN